LFPGTFYELWISPRKDSRRKFYEQLIREIVAELQIQVQMYNAVDEKGEREGIYIFTTSHHVIDVIVNRLARKMKELKLKKDDIFWAASYKFVEISR